MESQIPPPCYIDDSDLDLDLSQKYKGFVGPFSILLLCFFAIFIVCPIFDILNSIKSFFQSRE